MKKQNVCRFDYSKILFECEVPKTHSGMALQYTLEKATLSGADLSGAPC